MKTCFSGVAGPEKTNECKSLNCDRIWENPAKVARQNSKKKEKSKKRISEIMVPPESLSQYLSNEYQCSGVSIES
jgi:hypothetical protein